MKSVKEDEVHGVGPEQGAGDGAPLLDPGLKHRGVIEGLRHLLWEVPLLVGLGFHPGQQLSRPGLFPDLDVVPA